MRSHFIVLTAFTILTVLLTYPLIVQMDTHLAGKDVDVWINPWANYWMKKAITERLDFYHTDYQFYPEGVSLVFHSFSPLNTLIWWPLEPLVGTTAAYNLTILLAFILSGYGMWLLARYLTASESAAFLAGVVFAFIPYHMVEGSHPVIVSTQWIPLFALFLIKIVQEGRLIHGCLAALFLLLTALSSWHLFTFAVLWAMLYLAYTGLFERALLKRPNLKALMIAGLLTALFALPLLYPMLREQLAGGASFAATDSDEGWGNHPLAFFVPSQYHPLVGEGLEQANLTLGKAGTRPAFLGYAVLILGIHAALSGGKKTRFWALAASIFGVLSLGAGVPLRTGVTVSLPWAGPVVALWRHPFRFNIMISFCLAILVAYDLAGLLRGKGAADTSKAGKRRQILITVIVTSIVLFEYLTLPFPTTRIEVPPFYYQLAKESGDFAVAEVPIGRQENKFSLFFQTIHGKKLVGGVISRTPGHAYNYIEQNPLLFAAWQGDPQTLSASDFAPALAQLHRDDIRYVIVNKYLVEDWVLREWRDLFQDVAIYEDDKIVVYATAPSSGG